MEAKIYSTNDYGEFIEDSFFAGTPLCGITTAEKDASFVNKGFIVCGAAITGASCYYHGTIEQTAVLREIFPELPLHFTEGGPRLYDNYATDWCKWGVMLTKVFQNGYSSLTGWNLMLDEQGGPNVGPYFCGGLVTRNSIDGSLSYSGQSKAFRHFAMIDETWEISPLKFECPGMPVSSFPKQARYTEGCVATSKDGKTVLLLVNPSDKKDQIQYFHDGKWWYIEMMPNTLSTAIF